VFYRALELSRSPALRATFRPEVTGYDYVPRSGPVVLAANHLSFVDEFFTPIATRRQVTYLAKAEYFFGGLGHVPVDRDSTRAAAASIDICVRVLAEGRAFGIYPEGTRSPDGRLYKFRTGVARVALRSGAPVVPVGLVGTRDVQAPGQKMWHRAPLGVHFGPPMYFGHLADQERSSKVLREVTETIREAIQKLSGQEYVDSYASSSRS
jgi:1-acyl-sn-glycerol-3-phosphate acyltransferase